MDAIAKLNELANNNGVPLKDLYVYALGSAQEGKDTTVEKNTEEDNSEDTDEIVEEDSEIHGLQESEELDENFNNESSEEENKNSNQ